MGPHARFLARTVLVRNNDIDTAYRALDRILRNDGIWDRARRNLYYEKSWQARSRVSYDKCMRIYNADMKQKVEFIMRKNRVEPWVR